MPSFIVEEKLEEIYSVVLLDQVSMDGRLSLKFSSPIEKPNIEELEK